MGITEIMNLTLEMDFIWTPSYYNWLVRGYLPEKPTSIY